jgi:hypothetical protein
VCQRAAPRPTELGARAAAGTGTEWARPPSILNSYTEEETGRGLAAVALYSENTREAADALKKDGLPIPRSTLKNWLVSKRDDYERIRSSVIEKVHERVAEKHMELAEAQMELSEKLMDRLRQESAEVPVRDLPTAIRNLDVGSGIHTDKGVNLRAGAQPPINLPDIQETLRSLKASGVTNVRIEMVDDEGEEPISGSATEISAPRLVSGE